MKTTQFWLPCLLFLSGAAIAEDHTMTVPREGGDLIVNWGQPPPLPDQGRPVFDELDANNDGRLMLDETESHALLHTDFIFADSNRNGSLSRQEVERWNR